MGRYTSSMLFFALLGCPGAPTSSGTCDVNDAPTIDAAQTGGDWNLPEGVVNFGIPPQGGAPYAPFEVRLVGVEAAEAYRIRMSAIIDGETYTTPPINERFVCRNVGEESGTRYTPDLHMRFFGSEPPELDQLDVELVFEAYIGNADEPIVSRSIDAVLDWTLGPMPEDED